MPPVFAQMRGDAMRAGRFADFSGLDRIGFAKSAPAIARLAQCRDVVNVDAELEHNHGCGVASATAAKNNAVKTWDNFSIEHLSVPNQREIGKCNYDSDCPTAPVSAFIRRAQASLLREILAAGFDLHGGYFLRVRRQQVRRTFGGIF